MTRIGEGNETAMQLTSAAEGLLYTSEGDYPFAPVFLAGCARWPVDGAEFARLIGEDAGTPVQERSLEKFFERHIEGASTQDAGLQAVRPGFERLRDLLREKLRDVRVFRIGAVEVRCYIVGADADDNLVGLATTSVET